MHSCLYHVYKLNISTTLTVVGAEFPHKYDLLNLSMQTNTCFLSFINLGRIVLYRKSIILVSISANFKGRLNLALSPLSSLWVYLNLQTCLTVFCIEGRKQSSSLMTTHLPTVVCGFLHSNVILSLLIHVIACSLSFSPRQVTAIQLQFSLS